MDVQIREERNPKTGKPMTVVSGLTHNPQVIEALEKKLKSQCGAGGHTEKKTIYIQGAHTQKIATILEKEGYNIRKN
ncbi:MAG: translation initiation factor [Balneolaceae bacterium]